MTIINVDVGDSEVLPPCVVEVMTKRMPCLSRFLRLKPFLSLFGHFPLLSAAAGLLTGTLLCFGSCATPCAHTLIYSLFHTHIHILRVQESARCKTPPSFPLLPPPPLSPKTVFSVSHCATRQVTLLPALP